MRRSGGQVRDEDLEGPRSGSQCGHVQMTSKIETPGFGFVFLLGVGEMGGSMGEFWKQSFLKS